MTKMRIPGWDDADREDAALARVAARVQTESGQLTGMELAVVFLLSHGVPHSAAARMLDVPLHTVEKAQQRARIKLSATTAAHGVATALRLGLIA